ncbi:LamG-like jellyroll fold domain-containing protein [Rubritalea tangerina]|uniref:LamG-like jellyroll fold domain-containing protein n=1 Tax=Rubritalea tangerina TaxID=430798 RepID=A0ABW4ZE95_9BACT
MKTKKLRPTQWVAAIYLSTSCYGLVAGEFGNKHTLVIGIDGVRPDSLIAANTPNIDSIINGAAVTYNAISGGVLGTPSQQPTFSGPGWSSILTGVWADKHGVTSNSFDGRNYTNYPHFFSRIHQSNPNANLVSIVVWNQINDFIEADSNNAASFKLNTSDDVALTSAAVNQLANSNPDVLFVHFDEVDHAGHAYGYSTQVANYISAIEGVDTQIGTLLNTLQNRSNAANEDWQIIITTDHGGIGFGHGGQTVDERTIFIVNKASGAVSAELGSGYAHTIVPATVYDHLGLTIDPAWGWEDDKGFGYGPIYPSDLSSTFDSTTNEVNLSWKPQIASNITAYELRRDGSLIATLSSSDQHYTDTLALPPTPQEITVNYSLTAIGGSDSADAPVLQSSLVLYTGELSDALIAYYPFDGNFTDQSGKGNHANVGTGSPTFIGGIHGTAASLDGVDDSISLGSPADLAFGPNDHFSLSFWYRTSADQESDPVIISNKDWASGNNIGWQIEAAADNGDDFGLQIGDGSNRADSPASDLDFNTWYHVSAVFERGSFMSLYVNGTLVSNTDISSVTGSLINALSTNIGQDGTGTYSDFTLMDIDDLAIWRRALVPSEIQLIYQESQLGASLGDLTQSNVDLASDRQLFLPLDGDTTDLSSASNDGTLAGSPQYVTHNNGQALEFQDTASPHQFINLGSPSSLDFGSDTDFSVAVWVNNSGGFSDNRASGGSADDPSIISNKDWNSGVNKGWIIAAGANGRWQWNIGDGSSRVDYDGPAGEINDGNWHLLVVTHDRDGNATLYYDGAQVAIRDISSIGDINSGLATAIATDGTLGTNWPNWFTGKIDNPMIWNRVISANEVTALFNGETGNSNQPDPIVLFNDSFESGDLASNGWTSANGNAATQPGSALNGNGGAELKNATWIEISQDTTGYSNIHAKYARKTEAYDSGENLIVEWFDGSTWTNIETTQETTWLSIDATLGAGADNNPNFKLRFTTTANNKKEKAHIDEVIIEAIPLP